MTHNIKRGFLRAAIFGNGHVATMTEQLKATIIFLLVGALTFGSCSKERKEPKTSADPLMEISPALAIHMEMTKVDVQTCETLTQAFASTSKEHPDVKDTAERKAATCAVLKVVLRNNEAIAAYAVAKKSMPTDLFFFYEVEEETEKPNTKAIGLFKSADECRAAEETYRRFDIATRPCRQWNGKDLSLLG